MSLKKIAVLKDKTTWHHLSEIDKGDGNPMTGDELVYMSPGGRAVFVALAKRYKGKDAKPDEQGQWALSIAIPPEHDGALDELKAAINDVARAKFGKDVDMFKPGKAKGLKSPLLKADEKYSPEDFGVDDLEGWTLIRANSYLDKAPKVWSSKGTLLDHDEIEELLFTGKNCRMEVKIATYDTNGNKGVKFYLQQAQLLAGGDEINLGGAGPTSAFSAACDDEDDDSMN